MCDGKCGRRTAIQLAMKRGACKTLEKDARQQPLAARSRECANCVRLNHQLSVSDYVIAQLMLDRDELKAQLALATNANVTLETKLEEYKRRLDGTGGKEEKWSLLARCQELEAINARLSSQLARLKTAAAKELALLRNEHNAQLLLNHTHSTSSSTDRPTLTDSTSTRDSSPLEKWFYR